MRRKLILAVSFVVGGGLSYLWWKAHGVTIQSIEQPHLLWVLLGLLGLPISLLLQLVRTQVLFGLPSLRPLAKPLLYAHGMNVMLPSMLGDVYEISAVSRATGIPARAVLVRLLHRLSTTVGALLALAALALGSVYPSIGFGVLVLACGAPVIADLGTRLWSPWVRIPGTQAIDPLHPIGIARTLGHILLAFFQHALGAVGIFFIAIGIHQGVSPAIAAMTQSIADLVTYLPIPLAGAGVHHWGITGITNAIGSISPTLIAVNHAWVVLGGGLCIPLAMNLTGQDNESTNRHNG
jgi:hypothetical protein